MRKKRNPGVFGKEGTPLFVRAVELFNDGKFWEAHEVFEDLWRAQEGEAKRLAQGFVQAAAAFSYIKLKRYESILYLFDKSQEKLRAGFQVLPELHLSRLTKAIRSAKAEVQRLGPDGLEQFALYPRLEFARRTGKSRYGKK